MTFPDSDPCDSDEVWERSCSHEGILYPDHGSQFGGTELHDAAKTAHPWVASCVQAPVFQGQVGVRFMIPATRIFLASQRG